jgi:outer membrane protein with beta-barrel domain
MKLRTVISLSATLVALAAAPAAHADTMISGHAGKVFGGDLNDSRTTYGGALTFMGDGAFGFEIEGAYTPDFFGDPDLFLRSNNVSTLMGNILLGSRVGQNGRVYASVGGGLLKSSAKSVDEFFDVSRNDFGVTGGFGAMGFFTDNLGVRGDVRYFRNIGDPEPDNEFDIDFGNFSFWRGTAGIVLKF